MANKDRQLERLRNKPSDVRFDELRRVLARYGFDVRPGRGSHVVFRHAQTGAHLSIPNSGKGNVKPTYVRKAIGLIDGLPVDEDDGQV